MNVDRFKYHSYVLNNIRFFPCAIPLSRTHNEKNERTLCSKNTFFSVEILMKKYVSIEINTRNKHKRSCS